METQPSTEKKEKSIVDIALVAYLVCEKFKIIRIEKPKDKIKSYFVFENTQELNEAILKFYNKEGSVEPNHFHETLRNLKSYARQA